MPSRLLAALLLLFCALGVAGPESARGQPAQQPFGKAVEQWNQSFDRIGREAAGTGLTRPQALALKDQLAEIEAEARALKAQAKADLAPLESQLKALGPPPGEDDPPESEEIRKQRREIGEQVASYEGRIKQADLAIARVEELNEQISARTLERSLEEVTRLYPFPLAPDTIAAAVPQFLSNLALLATSPAAWWSALSDEQKQHVLLYRFALSVVLAFLLGYGIRRALLHWFGRDAAEREPSYTRRLAGAVADGVAHGIVPSLILGAFLARALSGDAVISGLFANVFIGFCTFAILFILARALPRAALAPDLPAWRLLPVSPEHARTISRRITTLAGIFALDQFLVVAGRDLVVSDELVSLYTLVAKTLEAGAILALTQARLWENEPAEAQDPQDSDGEAPGFWDLWTLLRRATALIAVAVFSSALVGYSHLSEYLAESLVLSGMAIGVLVLLRGLLRELIGVALRSELFQSTLGLPHKTRSRYKFWLRALWDLAVAVIAAAAVAIIWGVAPRELLNWVAQALQGFTVGNVTISLTDVLVAVAVFLVAMMATRMIQRVLNERVFPQTQLDTGVQHSLSAGFGYAGLALAIALAVSALGLDLENLAIIAGALSVGIGFGLQNVVNNFVSGLILLAERPIKVGDWIAVGAHEGFVKRINVRATEIETFQRSSVIVPNSELISGAVTNWTHKDTYGRVEVPVGVAYGSDVPKVMEILQGCLEANEQVLSWPEPYVLFVGFGDSSLDFEARGYLGDVLYRIVVASELRLAIEQAFREAGIQIPFPQRDLHIKSAAGLEGSFAAPGPQGGSSAVAGRRPVAEGEGEAPE